MLTSIIVRIFIGAVTIVASGTAPLSGRWWILVGCVLVWNLVVAIEVGRDR